MASAVTTPALARPRPEACNARLWHIYTVNAPDRALCGRALPADTVRASLSVLGPTCVVCDDLLEGVWMGWWTP